MATRRLLRKAAIGHFKKHPLQAALSIVGVALGVAVFVGIEGANGSALRAFELSTRAVTGRTTHQIIGESAGVPTSVYRDLRRDGVRWSAPVVEGFLEVSADTADLEPSPEAARPFRLLGIDPFAEEGFRNQLSQGPEQAFDLTAFLTRHSVILEREVARRLGVVKGDSLRVRASARVETVEVVGIYSAESDFDRTAAADLLVADISTAQHLLGLGDRLSRIDLVSPEGTGAIEAVRASLPAGLAIVRPEQRSAAAEQMTRAFRLNLRALSLLALLCGAFLIYNTMTFAVVQRRPLLGTLRALGATARELFGVVLAEAAAVGAVGASLGCLLGNGLARVLVGGVSQTVNDLYFSVTVREVVIPPGVFWMGAGLGIGAAILAALGPAVEALRTEPRSALARSELEGRTRRAVPIVTALGVALGLVGLALLAVPGSRLIPAFGGLFAILLGLACLTPVTTLVLVRLLTPVAGALFGNLGRLSARGVIAALSRTGIAIAALMMAIAVTVGVDVMIRSFRGTVDRWLAYSLPADLYITSPTSLVDRFSSTAAPMTQADIEALRSLPGFARINTVRAVGVSSSLGPVRLLAYDFDSQGHEAFRLAEGDADAAWEGYESGEAVLVSEPFAFRYGVGVGSTVDLETPLGTRTFPVTAVFYDYATEQGTMMMNRTRYHELWGDDGVTGAAVFLSNDGGGAVDTDAARRSAASALGKERHLAIRTNRNLRAKSLEVFDRTFVVTGVLRLLAVLVAFVGVLAALIALQLERGRELGVLRALGLTPREVWTLVTTQTGLIGLVAGLLSIPVGLTMSAIMVHVINRRSFGWSLDLAVSPQPLAAAVALAVAAALLAGVYPALKMARTSPAEALRGE